MYGAGVNDKFSDFFGRKVALIYKGPEPRVLAGNGAPEYLGRTQGTAFADVLPVQVANMKSLEELNSRMNGQERRSSR